MTDEGKGQQNTSADSEEGNSPSTGCDQDSSIFLQSDSTTTWTQLMSKKKIGSNTSREAQETLKTRREQATFHAG